MEQMNLIPLEVMAEISNGNSTKLPDNTLKMLQIMASLNTPKELLTSLLEIAEFSLHHVRYLAGPLVIHRSPWSDTIPQWLKFVFRIDWNLSSLNTNRIRLVFPAQPQKFLR